METGGKRVERRLAAILAADVASYSRLMSQDEVGTLRSLTAHREVMDRLIAEHGGRIANTAGDSVLAEFPSVVDAVQCAVEVQKGLADLNAGVDLERPLHFRIGIHVGDVMVRGADLLGDGVNVAARLEGLAEPGGVCLSSAAYEYVRKALPLTFTDLGPQQVKNIEEPIQAYAVAPSGSLHFHAPELSLHKQHSHFDKPSVAVLPFANLSGDPEQEYFADGMVEDIITALSRVHWFVVIARNSSFAYKGKAVDIRKVGHELGVRYVLEGSVRKAGGRIRIAGQLIEAVSGRHVWADKFDGAFDDIFDLQDRITESVVAAIEPSLRLAEVERARAKPTDILDAYDLYLQALPHHYSMTRVGLGQALALLHRAIALDPSYALAKAYAAFAFTTIKGQGWATEDEIKEGARLAREALAEHRNDPTTLALAGMAVAYLDRDFDAGVAALDRAMALNPMSALVVSRSAYVRVYDGDTATAIEHFHRAIRLSPLDPDMGFWLQSLCWCHIALGQFDQAIAWGEKATREMPALVPAWRLLAIALAHAGRLDEARCVLARVLELSPSYTIRQARSGMFLRQSRHAELYLEGLRLAGLPE